MNPTDEERILRLEQEVLQVRSMLGDVSDRVRVILRHLEIYGVEMPDLMTENPARTRLSPRALKTLRRRAAAHARARKPVLPGFKGGVSSSEVKEKLEKEAQDIRKKGDSEL